MLTVSVLRYRELGNMDSNWVRGYVHILQSYAFTVLLKP